MHESDSESLSRLMDGEWADLDPSHCAAAVCKSTELQQKWARYHLIRDALNNETVSYDANLAARVQQAIADEPAYSNVSSLTTLEPAVSGARHDSPDAADGDPAGDLLPAALTDQAEGAQHVQAAAPAAGQRRLFGGLALVASAALVTVVGLNVWQGAVAPADITGVDANTVAGNVSASGSLPEPLSTDTTLAPVVASSHTRILPTTTVPAERLPEVELVVNRGSHWVTASDERQAATEERLNMFLSQHIEHSPTADRTGMLPYSRLVGYDEVAD